MIVTLQNQTPNGLPAPSQIGFYDDWVLVYVTVFGAGQVRIAATQRELENRVNGQDQGIPIQTPAAGQNSPSFWWTGPLFGIASVNGTDVDFQVLKLGSRQFGVAG